MSHDVHGARQAAFGKRQEVSPVEASRTPPHPLSMSSTMTMVSCAAAGIVVAAFVDGVIWSQICGTSELRPHGGVTLDRMPAVTRPWAPDYVAPMIMAVIAAVVWRYLTLFGRRPSYLRGAAVMALLWPISMVVSFQCMHLGNFVQMWPLMEDAYLIMLALLGCVIVGFKCAAFGIAFYSIAMVPLAMIVGAILVLLTRVATVAGTRH